MLLLKQDQYLSIPNLIKIANNFFDKIPYKKISRKLDFLSILKSGIAIFYLKYSSLLEFDNQSSPAEINLKNLFGIKNVPSDTYFREIIDELENKEIVNIFEEYISLLEKRKILERYKVLNKYLLVSIDGC